MIDTSALLADLVIDAYELALITPVRLDPAVEARLDNLAQVTGRAKATVLHELIEQGIDDLEDAVLGAAALKRIREGKEKTYSLNEVIIELGLDASDL